MRIYTSFLPSFHTKSKVTCKTMQSLTAQFGVFFVFSASSLQSPYINNTGKMEGFGNSSSQSQTPGGKINLTQHIYTLREPQALK